MESTTPIYEIAKNFAELTARSIFITGNAGTGKTTFLKQLREYTHKQMAVVAPTGIAAINSGGVTMHSFFQLPFTPFVPTPEGRSNLLRKLHFNGARRRVMQELELLVIDEISMVRADLLDEIDTILRRVRYRHNEPFGGVQMIYIGDLYQLPPVAKEQDWKVISPYYQGPFFFHSRVIQEQQPIYIELDKIFRQKDLEFINLLNEVRNNRVTLDSMNLLESRYFPNFKYSEHKEYILLTTHNARAEKINIEEMSKIKSTKYTFEAKIEGEFSEKMFPNDPILELKEGAKIMFIANENGVKRRYYNGKIGVISRIDEDKNIFVKCDDIDEEIVVARETWENIRYTVNPITKQIEEQELGTFTQYPLRLAWAITIHKSQGLTFEKAVIDAESAFTSGQVYVALSRCRSLDGIILLSPIYRECLGISHDVLQYSSQKEPLDTLLNTLETSTIEYNQKIVLKIFDFSPCIGNVESLLALVKDNELFFNTETKSYLLDIQKDTYTLYTVSERFKKQLQELLQQEKKEQIGQRIAAACDYFGSLLIELLRKLSLSPAKTDNRDQAGEYNELMKSLFSELARQKHIIEGIRNDYSTDHYYTLKKEYKAPTFNINSYSPIFSQEYTECQNPDLFFQLMQMRRELCDKYELPVFMILSNKSIVEMATYLPQNIDELAKISGFSEKKIQKYGNSFLPIITTYCKNHALVSQIECKISISKNNKRKSTTKSKETKSTFEISLDLFNNGKTVEEIAELRGLTISTIEKHLARYLASGEVTLDKLVPPELEKIARELFLAGETISSVFNSMEGNLSYEQLRMVRSCIPELGIAVTENNEN